MARFLFTMLPANDLGLPTRMAPIARALADRGHEVAVFNPAPAPARLFADAGLNNLPVPALPVPQAPGDLLGVSRAWDVEELFGAGFPDLEGVRQFTALHVALIRDYAPDVVVDSFGPFACLACRILGVKLASVLQGNFHPASTGFLWWAGERPAGLASAAALFNTVAAEYGASPMARVADLLAGDLALIVGTPETDPVPAAPGIVHIGPVIWQRGDAVLPENVAALGRDLPVVWVYPGNPRYAGAAAGTPIDSIVVIRAAVAALARAPVRVVLTTGYQDMPAEFAVLPENFVHAAYVPGPAMAVRCDVMVHHGGHSSVMTGLAAGRPAVIIPTITERESNARRVVALGAGELVLPSVGQDGEKYVDAAAFGAAVARVLSDHGYREAAQRVARSMPGYGGAVTAAARIEALAGMPR